MTEPNDPPGMAEATRLLDDQTQQLMPVPVWLNELPGDDSAWRPPESGQ
ncbi:MAG TPA: hypothetical protein VFG87_28830 [Amycolatopsis sp.]|jgi:hypothetical protein|nr:hypothetical protein [Amycolatopsis sp.]